MFFANDLPSSKTATLASSKMEENASVASPKLSRTDSELLKCLEKEHSDEQVLKRECINRPYLPAPEGNLC